MYWPLAKASSRAVVVDQEQGNDCIRTTAGERLHDPLPERLAAHLGQQAGQRRAVDRAYSMTIERFSGSCRVSASRNQNQSPRAWPAATCRAWVLPVQPAGRSSIVIDPDPRVGRGELAGDRGGPVGAPVVDDQDFQVRVRLGADRGQAVGEGRLLVLGGDDRRDQGRARPGVTGGAGGQDVEPCGSDQRTTT